MHFWLQTGGEGILECRETNTNMQHRSMADTNWGLCGSCFCPVKALFYSDLDKEIVLLSIGHVMANTPST